jgi:hypothetical protein
MPSPVEQALAGPGARHSALRDDRVLIVPGGHRPGTPDQRQRDRNRAQLPISGPRRIVVLGCTVGAGQTMTALMTGEILASLRADLVAVFDLNPGPAALSLRARARPALSQAASLSPSRLEVLSCADGVISDGLISGGLISSGGFAAQGDIADGLGAADAPDAGDALDAGQMFERASSRYLLALADPSAAVLPTLLAVADQLLLVAPASAAAAGAIGMTFEWLEAHNQGALARSAVMVLNGVSRHTTPHVVRAEQVAKGQCRAIVRVPWDDQLKTSSQNGRPPAPAAHAGQHWAGLLSQASVTAYTALAGVLVAGLAGTPGRPAGSRPADL